MTKRTPKNRKPKYSGVLNEPMVFHYSPGSDSIFFDAKSQKEADRKTRAQWDERIAALYRHYQIERTSLAADIELAIKLACDHVPGFQYCDPNKRGRGRPGKWNAIKSLEMYADVKALIRRKPRRGASEACKILATNPKYSARYGGETPKNLLRRYHESLSAAGWFGKFLQKELSEGAPADDWVIDCLAMPELRGKS